MNPLNLLKLEWQKYFPNGTFRVIAVLYAGSFTMVLFLARLAGRNMTFTSNGQSYNPTADLFVHPRNWELVAWIGSWMNASLLGFMGLFMITLEFSNRTLRQSVIFGMSRMEVALGKLIWVLALALGTTGFYVLLTMAGEILDGGVPGVPVAGCVLRFFLQALGYLLLGTLVGMWIRQTALAALTYMAYVLVLENVCRWLFYFVVAKTRLLLFLPCQTMGALTPLPVPDTVNRLISDNPSTVPLSAIEAVLLALVYLGVFAAVFSRCIRKSDL